MPETLVPFVSSSRPLWEWEWKVCRSLFLFSCYLPCAATVDCVTLNIWRPSNASKDSRLPVVVYIHVSLEGQGSLIALSQFILSGWRQLLQCWSVAHGARLFALTMGFSSVRSRLPHGPVGQRYR